MLITTFPVSPWQSNCYVVATQEQADCLIIDPGPGAMVELGGVCKKYGLLPKAVLLTHGHVDHVGDAAAVCSHFDVPCWIHAGDRHLLADPAAGLSLESASFVATLMGGEPAEPADVREFVDGEKLAVAGLEITVTHAPGHTQGCVLLQIGGACFTGDVLFAGAIGRVDLPGGDTSQMMTTLRMLTTLDPDLMVLPGHGPSSTLAAELGSNPYLVQLG